MSGSVVDDVVCAGLILLGLLVGYLLGTRRRPPRPGSIQLRAPRHRRRRR
jgi:hypothetical protein